MSNDQWMWLGVIWFLVAYLFILRKLHESDEKKREQRNADDQEFWEERWGWTRRDEEQ